MIPSGAVCASQHRLPHGGDRRTDSELAMGKSFSGALGRSIKSRQQHEELEILREPVAL
jgi:hypothetical protein